MTVHDIRHRLDEINGYLVSALRHSGREEDYRQAIQNVISSICMLGDDLEKPVILMDEEERV